MFLLIAISLLGVGSAMAWRGATVRSGRAFYEAIAGALLALGLMLIGFLLHQVLPRPLR